jgi:UDP-GlcNAc:undecaprenyl-phosphate/decaprenyl-phosphate GlcNAc-1-phosphate transferase
VIDDAWAPPIAFAVSLILVGCLSRGRLAQIAVDRPNERSLHKNPVPRTGGLGLHIGILVAYQLIDSIHVPFIIITASMGLVAISILDDLYGLSVIIRLAVHLLASYLVVMYFLTPDIGMMVIIASILCVVWMINLYNFMDGSDGLAGGMAVCGFSCYGIAAYSAGNSTFAFFNFSIAASSAAFLVFNFSPARIFLGDAGSVPLGFLAATIGLVGWLYHFWFWWFPLLVFSPFIVDSTVTLIRRGCSRATLWHAHRDHYYQRLVQLGLGHRRTALVEFALMLASGAAALCGLQWSRPQQYILLGIATLVYAFLILIIGAAYRNHKNG